MEENNKLIAEFMGESEKFEAHKKWSHYHEVDYSNSWDWLMPVVEKIATESYDYGSVQRRNNVRQALDNVSMEQIYKAVVEFIQWYNENK